MLALPWFLWSSVYRAPCTRRQFSPPPGSTTNVFFFLGDLFLEHIAAPSSLAFRAKIFFKMHLPECFLKMDIASAIVKKRYWHKIEASFLFEIILYFGCLLSTLITSMFPPVPLFLENPGSAPGTYYYQRFVLPASR